MLSSDLDKLIECGCTGCSQYFESHEDVALWDINLDPYCKDCQ